MRYPSPDDPESPMIQSHQVGGICVVDAVEIIEVVVARISGDRSSI